MTHNLLDKIFSKRVAQICRAGSRFSTNCLCVSLYGDSDDVMRWAIKHGAIAVVSDHLIEDIPCIVSSSPEQFYSNACGYFRDKSNVKITAVAGSIGKTTTKRMIMSVYQEYFKNFNDPENENQMDCVGYICQHIPSGIQTQVQEVSEDTPGCMKYMSQMLKPDIVVITTIDKSHIEQYENQDKIYDEVCAITDYLKTTGTVIINHSDKEVLSHVVGNKILSVDINDSQADYYARDIKLHDDGLAFDIVDKANTECHSVKLHNVFAKHNILSALYAYAAGICSGEPVEKIIQGLNAFRMLGIRQNIYDSETGVKLYVDCYNAVGKSVKAAIDTAGTIPGTGHRIAVIGDIEEAGELSRQIHIDLIQSISDSSFDYLLTYGPKMKDAVEHTDQSFCESKNLRIKTYTDKMALARDLAQIAQTGDIVLFKASRKSALETIIESIWPKSYKGQMRLYSMAKLRWRMRVIFS